MKDNYGECYKFWEPWWSIDAKERRLLIVSVVWVRLTWAASNQRLGALDKQGRKIKRIKGNFTPDQGLYSGVAA